MISRRRAAAATLGFAWGLSACGGGDGFRFERGLAISPQRLDKSWGSGSDMQPYSVAVQLPEGVTERGSVRGEHDLILGSTAYSLVANEGELSKPVTMDITFPTWARGITGDGEYPEGTPVLWLEFGADNLIWANATNLAPGHYQMLLKIGYISYRGVPAQQVITVSLTVNPNR